jgi:hypothetical protein
MKITIRHPVGLEIEFEGEPPEFDRFTSFLNELPGFVGTLGETPAIADGQGDANQDPAMRQLDPRAILDRMTEVGASTDIERVTVMAHAATEAGIDGVDAPTVERIFTQLGLRTPPKLRATFSNAKQKGYIQSVGHGRWAPTIRGANFARTGIREPLARRGLRRANQGSLSAGGDPD